MGHDSIDGHVATRKIVVAAGLPDTWGQCPVCEGKGQDPVTQVASDAWAPTEPPTGDGWQMWETTSEGSPISPVFATPEALARWLADTNASALGSRGASYDAWLSMILGPGSAMSGLMVDGKMISGVAAGVLTRG